VEIEIECTMHNFQRKIGTGELGEYYRMRFRAMRQRVRGRRVRFSSMRERVRVHLGMVVS
jgi:hypothetical protein